MSPNWVAKGKRGSGGGGARCGWGPCLAVILALGIECVELVWVVLWVVLGGLFVTSSCSLDDPAS